jgi:hypothetical protein
MRPTTPVRTPFTWRLPVAVKVLSGFWLRALFLVIWNTAPVTARFSLKSSYLTPASQDWLFSGGRSWEAGVKYELLKENLAVTGAVFQITKYNARTQNPDNTFSATGNIQVKGVRTGVAGRITPEWQVYGGYTLLDARITNGIGVGTTGMIPQNTPRDSATLCGWLPSAWHGPLKKTVVCSSRCSGTGLRDSRSFFYRSFS